MSEHQLLYTDGACSKLGRGGWAAVIVREPDDPVIVSGSESQTTNNRMELRAAIEGLNALEPGQVELVTDSVYVLKGYTERLSSWVERGWRTAAKKPVKNVALWQELIAAVERHQSVDWHWTRGHDGDLFNEIADETAQRLAGTFLR